MKKLSLMQAFLIVMLFAVSVQYAKFYYGNNPQSEYNSITGYQTASSSCENRCGDYNPDSQCQCDSACDGYGDCCADRKYACG